MKSFFVVERVPATELSFPGKFHIYVFHNYVKLIVLYLPPHSLAGVGECSAFILKKLRGMFCVFYLFSVLSCILAKI